MTRIIVHSIEDMPGEARDGLPLGCVLETATRKGGPTVVAYGQGGTFSAKGLQIVATGIGSYVAHFEVAEAPDFNKPIRLQATDVHAALQWLREHYHGTFALYVETASTFLGEFDS